jgi:hypothetical protein
VSPEELLAYASGDTADARISAHLAICAACAEQAASYRKLDNMLRARLFRAACPSSLDLGEFVLGLNEPAEAASIRAHLDICPHCQAELGTLRDSLGGDPLADLLAPPGPLTRLIARLRPAVTPTPAASALRGNGSTGTLLYEAGDRTVALTIQATGPEPGAGWSVHALILDETDAALPPEVVARLYRDQSLQEETPLDEWSNITFSGLQPGTYSLEFVLGDLVIAIDDLSIGEPSHRE